MSSFISRSSTSQAPKIQAPKIQAPRSRAIRGLAAVVTCLAATTVFTSSADAATDRMVINFDADGAAGTQAGAGTVVHDQSGNGNDGVVRAAYGGWVKSVADGGGVVADFPGKCSSEPCPNALIEVADNPSLDPGTAPFRWGARIKLQPNETDDGENIVQKGTWGQAGGQWKLQVDKSRGLPSCVVSGRVPGQGSDRRVVLIASIGIADGSWHRVVCSRSASAVEIVIDGVARGSVAMPAVTLASSAPVTIGAKSVKPQDNDQFHGLLDDIFMTVP